MTDVQVRISEAGENAIPGLDFYRREAASLRYLAFLRRNAPQAGELRIETCSETQ